MIIDIDQFHRPAAVIDVARFPKKTTHDMRARYAVPPGADLLGYDVLPDHLKITYAVPGARLPITHRVML